MTKDEIINYWMNSADTDLKAMNSLFKSGHYVWALFLGHLVIEKLLKAVYVKNINADVPYIHNLIRIAGDAKLELTRKIDLKIEPHSFAKLDFDKTDPFVREIITKGKRIL